MLGYVTAILNNCRKWNLCLLIAVHYAYHAPSPRRPNLLKRDYKVDLALIKPAHLSGNCYMSSYQIANFPQLVRLYS